MQNTNKPMGTTATWEAFKQGARCGHIDGQDRAAAYVIAEEELLSEEAFANGFSPDPDTASAEVRDMWMIGYQRGYRLAAQGDKLPVRYQYPVDRKPSTWE